LLKEINYTEIELVQLLQKQEDKAFAYLYEKYHKALFTASFQIIGDTEICNDVLQQVFISIWQKIKMYDSSKGKLFTWMLNITKNASIDYLRSKAHKQLQKNQSVENNVYTSNLTTNDVINIDSIGIKKFIIALKEDYKQVLMQSYFEGFTHEEIAENLQIPVGTVKTRLRASLIELRKKMLEN
jgi:RNA polymerase sigma-70 factor (ECF subfamily)